MTAVDTYDAEQPIDPKLAQAIDAAFRSVSMTPVVFVATPRSWAKSNPACGPVKGPKTARKARIKLDLVKRDGARCAYCAREFIDLDDATLDHVIPNAVVGHWEPWNLLLACGPCNNMKADRVPLLIMPVLCGVLYAILSVPERARRLEKSRRDRERNRRARERWERRQARRLAAERQELVRTQIQALSTVPVRLAIEAAPQPLALPAGGPR